MKQVALLGILWLALLACSAPQAGTSPSVEGKRIRLSPALSAGTLDIPMLMAADALREQGYTVEVVEFAEVSQSIAGLAQQAVDVATSGHAAAMAGISQGGPIRLIVAAFKTPTLLVAKQEITSCDALNNRQVATNSDRTSGTIIYKQYLAAECPGSTPQSTVINGSGNRMAALLSEEMDAAIIELEDFLELEKEAPGDFHVLVNFADLYPDLTVTGTYVNQEWAEEDPAAVRDFLRALIEAIRSAQDPEVLRAAAASHFPDDPDAAAKAEAYLEAGVWNVNGTLTPDVVQTTLDFVSSNTELETELTADDVADLSYLNAVLDEIGRE